MTNYDKFLASKAIESKPTGIIPEDPNAKLFPFQRDIVKWALRRGKACIWADCGLGKTFMQLEWAKQIPGPVLILAPLAVAQQTVEEGKRLGIEVQYHRKQPCGHEKIVITNYEMLEHFDLKEFSGLVLDESSILKSYMGKTKRAIIEKARPIKYKLACTATPAPNDHMEIGNHCEFLDVMTSSEMLASYFINDPAHVGRYRLKGHAENAFWEWVASWAVMIRKPSDLGYDDSDFILPGIKHYWHEVECHKPMEGELFSLPAASLSERIAARRNSVEERVDMAIKLANECENEQVLAWCALNSESAMLAKNIVGAVEVVGSDSIDFKERALTGFAAGKIRCLVSKPSICGFGMNFQSCRRMVFVGLSDSWEQYYQAVRRCWRFGQQREVECHVITATNEGAVVANVRRKEADSIRMSEAIAKNMSYISSGLIREKHGFKKHYKPCQKIKLPTFIRSSNNETETGGRYTTEIASM